MKATEARKLTNKNLKGPVIQPALDAIYRKIEIAAKNGEDSLSHPFRGIPNLTDAIEKAVELRLRSDGFKIVEVEGCDDGPNRSSPGYTVIKW